MFHEILDAKAIHAVADRIVAGRAESAEEAYRREHRAAISRMRTHGIPAREHESAIVLAAYVNHGRWVVDCECGAGNAPLSDVARCFGCGAVHSVTYPRTRKSIEKALLARPQQRNRNWYPHESVDDLRRENAAHNIMERT